MDENPTATDEPKTLFRKTKGARIAIGVLVAVGVAAIVSRIILRGRHGGVAEGDTVWKLICRVEFTARKEGAIVRIALPADTANIRVFGQDFATPGLRQQNVRGRGGMKRDAVAIAFRKGRAQAEAEFDLHMSPKPGWNAINNGQEVTAEDRVRLLKPEPDIQADDALVKSVLASINDPQQKKRMRNIFDYCTEQIAFDAVSDNEDALSTLKERAGTSLGRSRAIVALCRAGKIPARVVAGFVLDERREPNPQIWAEALLEKKWVPFDAEFGNTAKLPANYLPVRRGGHEIVRVSEAADVDVTYQLQRQPAPRGLLAGGERNLLEVLDLSRLPLATQLSLATLLLLPFGALLTTFFRNLIGVRTFGTFSPTLLALAAVYADWKTVAMIFALVILIGVGGRALLPGFKLMQVPRLSIVFTLVAVSMMLSVSLLDYFGLNPTGQIALLPMVVLTSLVDRIYTVADDDGLRVAGVRLAWTVGVGAVCFLLFLWKGAGLLILDYPEFHFITIAMMLLLGLYKGPKLADYSFFQFLAEPKSEKKDEDNTPEGAAAVLAAEGPAPMPEVAGEPKKDEAAAASLGSPVATAATSGETITAPAVEQRTTPWNS